jgi:peptide/nickel transport system ATP-binding protein
VSAVLEAREVRVAYGSFEAVRSVSLTVAPGEVLGIVGASGSGKSSLAKALVGLVPLAGGAVFVDGQRWSEGARRLVQSVFQDPNAALDPRWSVAQSLSEPLAIDGLPRSPERIAAMLEAVELDRSLATRLPRSLSAGQRQRVTIARALAGEPKVLVLDEPVSALDGSVQAQILNLLRRVRQARGLAMVLISHDLDVVAYMADRIIEMHDGRFVVK